MTKAHVSADLQRPSKPAGPVGPVPRTILSSDLLLGGREVQIRHGEETYRLRLTKAGKLLLYK